MSESKSTKNFVAFCGTSNEFPSNYSGEATVTYKNGEKFVGVFESGKKKYGKYYYSNKSVYDGFFMNEKKSGVGKLSKRNNEEFYYGNFQNGKKHGEGFQKYWNGDIYYGEWKNNKKNGKGIYYISSRKEYLSGEWTKGYLLNGLWMAKEDFRFDGKFFQNKPKNSGSFLFLNNLEMNVYFKHTFNVSDLNNDNDNLNNNSDDYDDNDSIDNGNDDNDRGNITVYWYHRS